MKSLLRKDEVAPVCGGFHSTRTAGLDFIRIGGLHHKMTSSRNPQDFGISPKEVQNERKYSC